MAAKRVSILCESCERNWALACSLTIYEQQTLESRPCPHCGAYTLTCQDADDLVGAGASSKAWHTRPD